MKKNKTLLIFVIILFIVILVAGGILAYKILKDKTSQTDLQVTDNDIEEELPLVVEQEVVKKEPKIFNGTDRPIAVMIDNHSGAWPQANLNSAYIVYEIIVEGGETRLMALFKAQDLANIGPVRSSRHYFLDYALENDAIYIHYGWSPQAQSDIPKLGVNNINGITESSSSFWRVKNKSAPHNVMTSTAKILEIAAKKGYSVTSDKKSVLNYNAEEQVILPETALVANTVSIPFSTLQKVRYEYDVETGRYTRYARNKLQKDYDTGEPVTAKNLIITFCENYTLNDGENKDRQGLNNIGTFDGYYITNGKAIQIKCIKDGRNAQTKYEDFEGNEIQVNDGNTFISICSISNQEKVVIE